MLDGRENGVLSSFIYKREEVHTPLLAQQLEISLDLMICNQRTLVLRLPHPAGLSLLGKDIFRAILAYALLGPVLWGTSAMPKVRRVVSPFSPFQASPGSPSGTRQELGSVYAMELLPNRPGSSRSNGKYVVTLTPIPHLLCPKYLACAKAVKHTPLSVLRFFLLTISVGHPHLDFSPLP